MRYIDNESKEIVFKNGRATLYERDPATGELVYKKTPSEVLGFLESFKSETERGRILYGLTVTYTKSNNNVDAYESSKNRFHNLYWHHFLPKVHFNTKRWTKNQKHSQPITYVFTEKHSPKAHTYTSSIGISKTVFPDHIHHHAFLSVDPQFADTLNDYVGENTFKIPNSGIMTTHFTPCDLGWIIYSTKMYTTNMNKYEYFCYGPTMN